MAALSVHFFQILFNTISWIQIFVFDVWQTISETDRPSDGLNLRVNIGCARNTDRDLKFRNLGLVDIFGFTSNMADTTMYREATREKKTQY